MYQTYNSAPVFTIEMYSNIMNIKQAYCYIYNIQMYIIFVKKIFTFFLKTFAKISKRFQILKFRDEMKVKTPVMLPQ